MSLVRSKGWDESKGRGGKEVCAVSGHFRSIGKETESWPSCVALLDDVLLEAHPSLTEPHSSVGPSNVKLS